MICPDCNKINSETVIKRIGEKVFKIGKRYAHTAVAALAVVLTVAIVLGFALTRGPHNYGLYIKNGEMYYTELDDHKAFPVTEKLAESMSAGDIYGISHNLSNRARITEDGKLLFYVDNIDSEGEATLCCRSVNDRKKLPVQIDRGVYGYSVTADGEKGVYIKEDKLYLFLRQGLVKEVVAENVTGVMLSNDGDTAIYTDGENRCFTYKTGGKPTLISAGVEGIFDVSDDFKTVYFKKENAVYKWMEGKTAVRLVDGVYAVISPYDSGEFYFVRATSSEVLATEYINDNVKDSDAAMTKPAYPLPPARKDYKTKEEWKADYDIYLGEMDRYYQLMNEYYDKQARDVVRTQLDGYKITLTSYSLYFYNGTSEVMLAENYNFDEHYRAYNPKSPALAYSVYINDTMAKLSDIKSIEEVESAILACRQSFPKVQLAIGDTVQSVTFGVQSSSFGFSSDGMLLYYIDGVNTEGTLGDIYTVKVSKTAGEPELYDRNVDTEQGIALFENGSVAYYKNVDGTLKGTLYIDEDKVADDVAVGIIEFNKNSKMYAFYTDYDGDSEGTLNVYKNGKTIKVSDKVHRHSFTPAGDIMYLKEYSMDSYVGDLYYFNGKKSKKMDIGVTAIVDAYSYSDRNELYY